VRLDTLLDRAMIRAICRSLRGLLPVDFTGQVVLKFNFHNGSLASIGVEPHFTQKGDGTRLSD
jgi:hypothetical protein